MAYVSLPLFAVSSASSLSTRMPSVAYHTLILPVCRVRLCLVSPYFSTCLHVVLVVRVWPCVTRVPVYVFGAGIPFYTSRVLGTGVL